MYGPLEEQMQRTETNGNPNKRKQNLAPNSKKSSATAGKLRLKQKKILPAHVA